MPPAENDEPRVVVDLRASLHTATCSGGEGHPHRDCYCDVHWNDDKPKSACPECAMPPTEREPFWCYPCARGEHGTCTGIAWQPDVECECDHA